MNRTLAVILGLFVLLLSISGCSHKSSVTSATIGQGRTSPHIGDRVMYRVKFSASDGTNDRTIADGNRIYTVVAHKDHRRSLPSYITKDYDVQSTLSMHSLLRRKNQTMSVWFGEDAAGNIYLLGMSTDGESWDISTDAKPQIYMPAKIKAGSKWKCIANCDTGNTISFEFAYIGTESISTPMGDLNTYKLSSKSSFGNNGNPVGFVWMPTNLPIVFEMKEEYESKSPGTSVVFKQNYAIDNIELAK